LRHRRQSPDFNRVIDLSYFLKTHRSRYYELLDGVRRTGNWENWLEFFAEATVETATEALDTAQRLLRQAAKDRLVIGGLSGVAGSALRVHEALLERPIASAAWIAEKSGLALATVNTCLRHLQAARLVSEVTGRQRDRLFAYDAYVSILNEGTDQPY